jgi:hypothetical protein
LFYLFSQFFIINMNQMNDPNLFTYNNNIIHPSLLMALLSQERESAAQSVSGGASSIDACLPTQGVSKGSRTSSETASTSNAGRTTTSRNKRQAPAARRRRTGGIIVTFPYKLRAMLDGVEKDAEMSHFVSWNPEGTVFIIRKPREFAAVVLPIYFRTGKFASFQRQLHAYGFVRTNLYGGRQDEHVYQHERFLRDRKGLIKTIKRVSAQQTDRAETASPTVTATTNNSRAAAAGSESPPSDRQSSLSDSGDQQRASPSSFDSSASDIMNVDQLNHQAQASSTSGSDEEDRKVGPSSSHLLRHWNQHSSTSDETSSKKSSRSSSSKKSNSSSSSKKSDESESKYSDNSLGKDLLQVWKQSSREQKTSPPENREHLSFSYESDRLTSFNGGERLSSSDERLSSSDECASEQQSVNRSSSDVGSDPSDGCSSDASGDGNR